MLNNRIGPWIVFVNSLWHYDQMVVIEISKNSSTQYLLYTSLMDAKTKVMYVLRKEENMLTFNTINSYLWIKEHRRFYFFSLHFSIFYNCLLSSSTFIIEKQQ